ncbi:MAG: hypothetical protein NZM94_12605, partial [Roseiflexus sp.]|nr:hypothetical protein [Roseiflexus sp.]
PLALPGLVGTEGLFERAYRRFHRRAQVASRLMVRLRRPAALGHAGLWQGKGRVHAKPVSRTLSGR